MPPDHVATIQVSLPREYGTRGALDPMDAHWRTGFFKEPVRGPVWAGRTNLAGDGQADLRFHGGPDKAILLYAAAHYPHWHAELGRPPADLPHGAFGENLTLEGVGFGESTVCIGDVYAIGPTVRLEVSQPRQPCWKLGRRWRIADLPSRVQRTGRTGWYARVLREGDVEAGQAVRLVDRPFPEWTIARAARVIHDRNRGPAGARNAAELAALPPLAAAWRDALAPRGWNVPDEHPER